MRIDIKGIKPEKKLFHNIWLPVYPKTVNFTEIDFWPENHRTELDFDLLEEETGKEISELSIEEITNFLVGRYDLRLVDLAKSIEKNGVRVPLIILDDWTLLDGNRRYFACSYIHQNETTEQVDRVLENIPVWVIKKGQVDDTVKQKILAEANFVTDYKVPWPLKVKAQVIYNFYKLTIEDGSSKEQAYGEIKKVYGVNKSEIVAYIETIQLAEKFIASAPKNKNDYRQYAQDKFLYFWEFRNKSTKGRTALDSKQLPKVKKLFFKMIATQRFKNFKQVEPMIRAVRDEFTWELLSSSKGSKIDIVEAIIKEERVVRSSEDKVRNFLKWLQDKADPSTFTKATFTQLEKLATKCSALLKKRKAK